MPPEAPRVAIVDYGVGNLFSVMHACSAVGLKSTITAHAAELLAADAVILPGVGAFGDAMAMLRRLDLVAPLQDIAASGKPLIGICLGMQLFMSESEEFGVHRGLGIIAGPVLRFPSCNGRGGYKVPQVGWNRILPPAPVAAPAWTEGPLQGIPAGAHMYFVHSFYARPQDAAVALSISSYAGLEFCSSLRRGNVFACQFHPERSGRVGLEVYRNIAAGLARGVPGSSIRV